MSAPAEAEKVASWLVMWGCLCSDVRVKRADLPKVCPGHGREPIAKPEPLDALARFVDVHECPPSYRGEAGKCPEVKAS